jgi:hypothetical protein
MSGLWICQLESRQDDSLVATLIVVEGIIKFGVFCGVSIAEYETTCQFSLGHDRF